MQCNTNDYNTDQWRMKYKKGTLSRDGFYTKSISERLWFSPTIWFFCRSYQCQCRMVGLEKVAFCVLLHILYTRQPHKISFFKRHLCQATSILMYARKRADLTQKTCRTWQTCAIAKFLHAQQSFQNSLRFPPAFSSMVKLPCANSISLLLFCAEVISCSETLLFF